MTNHLLFVCTANVCRSPLMEFTFRACTEDDAGVWTVVSRGTAVARTRAMCTLGQSLVSHVPAGAAFAESHASKGVSSADIEQADMILTASREERAEIARMLPTARPRLFTLREALALGDGARNGEADSEAPLLTTYVSMLDARRGRVPRPRSRQLLWRSKTDPLDIPDVHHERSRHHLSELKKVQEDVRTLHARIAAFAGVIV